MKIWQFTGYHNSGKTTFLTQLTSLLVKNGLKTAVIKHHGHQDGHSELMEDGTDTARIMASSPESLTYITENKAVHYSNTPLELNQWVLFYQIQQQYDVLLIEGFKRAGYMKVVFHRSKEDDHLLASLENIQYILTTDDVERIRKLTDIPVYSQDEKDILLKHIAIDIGGGD